MNQEKYNSASATHGGHQRGGKYGSYSHALAVAVCSHHANSAGVQSQKALSKVASPALPVGRHGVSSALPIGTQFVFVSPSTATAQICAAVQLRIVALHCATIAIRGHVSAARSTTPAQTSALVA